MNTMTAVSWEKGTRKIEKKFEEYHEIDEVKLDGASNGQKVSSCGLW